MTNQMRKQIHLINHRSTLSAVIQGLNPMSLRQVAQISYVALLTVFSLLAKFSQAQCTANPGSDQIYVSTPVTLGLTNNCASGGVTPYTYQWLPNTGFAGGSTNTQCNPQVAPA